MVAVIAFHPGKTQMKITAVQIFVYDVQHIRSPIPIFLLIPVFPCAFQFYNVYCRKNRLGGGWGLVALLVFKTSRWADEVHGEFDSHTLPPQKR